MSDPEHPDVAQFIERLGGALAAAGMALQPSRAFAALLAAEGGRLTAAELAGALQISPSAVSGAVSYLAQVGLMRRERERGSRRDVYVVADDAWHDAVLRKDQTYGAIMAALADGIRASQDRPDAQARMGLSLEFLEFVSAEMDGVIARWEERRRAAGASGVPRAVVG
jgi:DNA-binding transcriptional regulator GbsR (MarR family)